MFDLFSIAICICDGILIYKILKAALFRVLGDSKIFRAIKLFIAFPCGVAYAYLAMYVGFISYGTSLILGGIVIFGPVGLFTILCIIGYIKGGK